MRLAIARQERRHLKETRIYCSTNSINLRCLVFRSTYTHFRAEESQYINVCSCFLCGIKTFTARPKCFMNFNYNYTPHIFSRKHKVASLTRLMYLLTFQVILFDKIVQNYASITLKATILNKLCLQTKQTYAVELVPG